MLSMLAPKQVQHLRVRRRGSACVQRSRGRLAKPCCCYVKCLHRLKRSVFDDSSGAASTRPEQLALAPRYLRGVEDVLVQATAACWSPWDPHHQRVAELALGYAKGVTL